jgi:hypothetical protein
LTEALQPGERVLWQGQPDGVARMMMWRALWWIGFPWLLLTAIAISRGWTGQSTVPLLMVGITMVAAPFVMLLHDLQTLFAITNRRALIVRTAWGKRTVTATGLEDMDAAFEISDIGRGAGHLNFASGPRPALPTRITPAATGSAASETLRAFATFWSTRVVEKCKRAGRKATAGEQRATEPESPRSGHKSSRISP